MRLVGIASITRSIAGYLRSDTGAFGRYQGRRRSEIKERDVVRGH
jgi:hypothetical protein